jgi:hypothetical protein
LRKRNSRTKTSFDDAADRAIELARDMSPGPGRIRALKEAGLLRLIAELASKIAARERPPAGSAAIEQKRNVAAPVKRPRQDNIGQDDIAQDDPED